jgi:hypothetical protein
MTVMRILSLVMLFAFIFWSLFWWNATQKMENSVERWFHQQTIGLDHTYEKISTSGFPNRVDLTIKNASYSDYKREFSISAKLIQLLTLFYKQDRIISVIKPPINIKYMNKHFKVEGNFLKSSLNFGKEKELLKIVTEGSNLKLIDPNEYEWVLTDLLFASEKEATTLSSTYRSHLTLHNITVPLGYFNLSNHTEIVDPVIKKISFNGTTSLTQDFYNSPSLKKISEINDLMIEIDWGLIKSSLTGNLNFSDNSIINGSLRIMIINWQDLLLVLHEEKILNEKLFKTIKASLTFIASQTKDGDQSLKIPLNVKNNFIFLGPVKIGEINSQSFM